MKIELTNAEARYLEELVKCDTKTSEVDSFRIGVLKKLADRHGPAREIERRLDALMLAIDRHVKEDD